MVTITELKKQRRWVLWRLEKRDGKETKVPYQPSGRRADSSDPATWRTHAEVIERRAAFSGVGVVLGEVDGVHVSGVDIDKCYDIERRRFTPESREYVKGLDSYTEFSPSGDGVHILLVGNLRGRKGTKQPMPGCKAVELYDGDRYLTFTGRYIDKTPADLLDRTERLNALYDRVLANKPQWAGLTVSVSLSEQERLQKLMAGDMSFYGDDRSKADFALCCLLAKKHGCNPFKVDDVFRTSGLYREKWERDDYRGGTIGNAIIAVAKETVVSFGDSEAFDEDTVERECVVQALSGREYEGWFPCGEISLVCAGSGLGKTTFLLHLLEAIRQGKPFLGHETKPRDYRILNVDRSRRALLATARKQGVMEAVRTRSARLTEQQLSMTPGEVLRAAIEAHPGPEVWIMEGLDLWADDANKMSTVRLWLDGLARVALAFNVCVIATVGAPKQKEGQRYTGRDRAIGSGAWSRMTEAGVFMTLHDQEDANSVRVLEVMVRNGKTEVYFFTWIDGVLTFVDEPGGKAEVKSIFKGKAKSEVHGKAMALFGMDKPVRFLDALGVARSTYDAWRNDCLFRELLVKRGREYYFTMKAFGPVRDAS